MVPSKPHAHFDVTGTCSISMSICARGVPSTCVLNMSRILDFSPLIMPSFIFAFFGAFSSRVFMIASTADCSCIAFFGLIIIYMSVGEVISWDF